jgi:hypothetical protein
MGLDLCLSWITIDENRQPDWGAARSALAALSNERLQELAWKIRGVDYDDEATPDLIRDALSAAIDPVSVAIATGSRELGVIPVPGWIVYTTGGLSAGDAPTDLFEHIEDLCTTGLATAAGFMF